MGIYSPLNFDHHLGTCARCREIFEKSQKFRIELLATKKEQLPPQLDWEEILQSSEELTSEEGSRFPLLVRVATTAGVGFLMFLGVSSAPDLREYFRRDDSPKEAPSVSPGSAQKGENQAPTAVEQALQEPQEEAPLIVARTEVPAPPPPAPVPTRVTEKPVPAPPIPVPNVTPAPKPTVVSQNPAPVAVPSASTTKVFFRWGARAADPDRMSEKVLAWLQEISAQNAGELGFGAIYRGGRYFHFTIPKGEYDELLSKIKSLPLTDFTYSAADGDRQIPSDRSRIVFWIGPPER